MEPVIDPKKCLHKFVKQMELWYGQGTYVVFECKDCLTRLTPVWREWKIDDPKVKE